MTPADAAAPRSRVLHRSPATPITVTGGHGIWLRTADGQDILDACGGAAVSCLGHGHPHVTEAIHRQADRLAYAHSGFFTNEPAEALAEILVGHEPGRLAWAYFVSGGSEAVEAALKLARQHHLEHGQPKRVNVIARRMSYHGNTLGALGASGNTARRAPYLPLLAPVFSHVSPAFAYRFRHGDESEADYTARLAQELENEFRRLGPGTVAAVVAEPLVGATLGCVPAPAGYFQAVRDICDHHGALLILDEIMSGMGRTGTLHAWEQEKITPDIQVIAKGLGGGYQPIGAILATDRVIAPLRDGSGGFAHGHTYLSHPIACAAALAVQEVIRDEHLVARVRTVGALLEDRLVARFGNHPNVGNIRGRGLFWGLEFVADRATKIPFAPALQLNQRIKAAAFARGLACYPGSGTVDGLAGDHVLLAPPYIVTAAEIDLIVDRLGAAVDAAVQEASVPH